jgi:hypothetical protein
MQGEAVLPNRLVLEIQDPTQGVFNRRPVQSAGFMAQKKLLSGPTPGQRIGQLYQVGKSPEHLYQSQRRPVLGIGHVNEKSADLPVIAQTQAMPENPIRSKKPN